MVKRKIAVVTGSRAEYGLLKYLMKGIAEDAALELQLVVTGMHLSPEFGMTFRLIEQDGFVIASKVEMLMSSDSAIGIAKSIGLGVMSFADSFAQLQPDIIVLLGDRFEILAAAQAALVQKIPVAHIHGGELSEGAIDDAIRHSITKMSHLHFVAAEPYRKRVIQLGESPDRVFNVGAPGLERITKMQLLDKASLEKEKNFKFGTLTFLVTYHPETIAIEENQNSIHSLFEAIESFKDATVIFTKANADESGRYINKKIDEYVSEYSNRAYVYVSLGDLHYLSLLQYVDVAIGNSSSGLIEVPFFRKPTVNMGNRQKGRLKASSVIDCDSNAPDIIAAIKQALSKEFNEKIKTAASPYNGENTASKMKNVLKKVNLKTILVKQFNDISLST